MEREEGWGRGVEWGRKKGGGDEERRSGKRIEVGRGRN